MKRSSSKKRGNQEPTGNSSAQYSYLTYELNTLKLQIKDIYNKYDAKIEFQNVQINDLQSKLLEQLKQNEIQCKRLFELKN